MRRVLLMVGVLALSLSGSVAMAGHHHGHGGHGVEDRLVGRDAHVQAVGDEAHEPSGGADAHVFNLAGIPCLNLCSGMEQVHTPDEHIRVDHLEQLVDLTVELVRAATRVV